MALACVQETRITHATYNAERRAHNLTICGENDIRRAIYGCSNKIICA